MLVRALAYQQGGCARESVGCFCVVRCFAEGRLWDPSVHHLTWCVRFIEATFGLLGVSRVKADRRPIGVIELLLLLLLDRWEAQCSFRPSIPASIPASFPPCITPLLSSPCPLPAPLSSPCRSQAVRSHQDQKWRSLPLACRIPWDGHAQDTRLKTLDHAEFRSQAWVQRF